VASVAGCFVEPFGLRASREAREAREASEASEAREASERRGQAL